MSERTLVSASRKPLLESSYGAILKTVKQNSRAKMNSKHKSQSNFFLHCLSIAVPRSPMNHKKYLKVKQKYLKKIYGEVYFYQSYSLQPATVPKMSSVTDRLRQFCEIHEVFFCRIFFGGFFQTYAKHFFPC